MEGQRELLAEIIWRVGTRIQTGWWYASLGRILDTQNTLDEGQVAAICEQSRPVRDRQGQKVVFRLHAGKYLDAETPEERRKWIVTLLTAFRLDWSCFLQRQNDMGPQGKEAILENRSQVTERYKRCRRQQEANQAARRRARMQTADERGGEESPATVPEHGTHGHEESCQASGTCTGDTEVWEPQTVCRRGHGTSSGQWADDPHVEAPELSTTPRGRQLRPRDWKPGDVAILQRPTQAGPQEDSSVAQRSGGERPPRAEPRRTYPSHQSRARTWERTGRQMLTQDRTWTDRNRWGYYGRNERYHGWEASASTPPWRTGREAPQRRGRGYGYGMANIRLAVQVQVSMTWAQPPWAEEGGTGTTVPLWHYPGQGEDAHTVSDGEESDGGDGRHGLCVICYSRNATRILWDCGHIITCGKCTRELFRLGHLNRVRVTCPQCRRRVWDTRRSWPTSRATETT